MNEQFGSSLILLDQLGAGGMAEIYRARLVGTGGFEKIVAVKRILPHLVTMDGMKVRFEREISLASRLQHPNVVQVFQSGELDEYLYVVMEFVDGKNIAQIIKQTMSRRIPLSLDMAIHIISEAARGLEYAHTLTNEEGKFLGIVHRDVNPRNIMVGYKGAVKVVDFGIAKAVDQTQLTLAQSFTGTARYASPEQVRGEDLDARSDVFSLGVVLFEMLTQQHLFPGESSFQIMNAVINNDIPDIQELRRDIPDELAVIVYRAVAKDREERYENARAFYEDLVRLRQKLFPQFLPEHLSDFMKSNFSEVIHSELIERRRAQPVPLSGSLSFSRTNTGAIATQVGTNASRQLARKIALFSLLVLSLLGAILVGILLVQKGPLSGPRHTSPFTREVLKPGETVLPVFGDKAFADEKQILALPGFLGWLSAKDVSDGTQEVRSWKGKGESPLVAFQSNPIQSPRFVPVGRREPAGLFFDGTDDYLILDGSAERFLKMTALTLFVHARVQSDRSQYFFSMHGPGRTDDVFRFGTERSGILRLKATTRAGKYIDSLPGVLQQRIPQVFVALAEGGKFQIRQQGKVVLDMLLGDIAYFQNARFISIGQEYDDHPSDFFHGLLYDLVFFERVLSLEEIQKMEGYLYRQGQGRGK